MSVASNEVLVQKKKKGEVTTRLLQPLFMSCRTRDAELEMQGLFYYFSNSIICISEIVIGLLEETFLIHRSLQMN